jgi:hypothetical protein
VNDRISSRLFAAGGVAAFGLAGPAFAVIPHSTTEFAKIGEPDFYGFTMSGTDRHFGRYSAFGEIGASTGAGVVVLTASNGDQIAGVVNAAAEADDRTQGHFHLSWSDSVIIAEGPSPRGNASPSIARLDSW